MQQLKENIKQLLMTSLNVTELDEDISFIEAGGNSMQIMEIISEIEDKYNITLDIREIMSNPTVNEITEIVYSIVGSKEKKDRSYRTEKKLNLYDECKLSEEITLKAEYTLTQSECKNYFLTGASGFLGAFLIHSLLEKDKNILLYCHVRSTQKALAKNKIKSNMIKYDCWKEEYFDRIIPVLGDLRKPNLGIEQAEYDFLSQEIDTIIHNGAMLNFIYSYDYLRKTNVYSTEQAISFAFNKKSKYFTFVSSYSVYDNPSHFAKKVSEDDPLLSADGYFLGYSETKWVCEKILQIASNRGLRTVIVRPGDITGEKRTGIWEARDLTSRVIIGCIQMHVLPIIKMRFNFTPVDYVADAITYITGTDNTYGHAYNIINPVIKPATELYKACLELNIPVIPISYKLWKKKLHDSNLGKNALKILESMFNSNDGVGDIVERHSSSEPIYSTKNTETVLKSSNIKCQPMDKELIKAYLKYFKKNKII